MTGRRSGAAQVVLYGSLLLICSGISVIGALTLSGGGSLLVLSTALCIATAGMTICLLLWLRSRWTTRRLSTPVGLLVALTLLLLVAAVDYAVFRSTTGISRTKGDAAQLQARIQALQDSWEGVRRADSALRDYLLTGDARCLADYQLGVAEVRHNRPALAGNSSAQGLLSLTDQEMTELAKTVTLARSGQHERALQLVKSGPGLSLRVRIERETTQLARHLTADLSSRLQASQHALLSMQHASLLTYLLAVTLVFLGILSVRSEMRQRSRMEGHLRENERELELKVRARTTELMRQKDALQSEIERRVLSEKALRETDDQLRLSLGFARMAAWNWSSAKDVTAWSGPVEEVFGVPGDQLTTYDAFYHLILPEDRDVMATRLEAAKRNLTEYTAEFRIVRPDGDTRWIAGLGGSIQDAEGNLIGMAGVNFDISEKRAAQEKLETSERRFRELAEAMPHIVWTASGSGEFEYYNGLWYEVTGFVTSLPPNQQDPSTVLHSDDFERWQDAWLQAVQTGQSYEIEYRSWDVRKEEFRWYLGHAVPVRNQAGEVVRWFGTSTDMHERKIARLQLAEKERALELREQQLAMVYETGIIGNWSMDLVTGDVRAHPSVWKLWGAPEPLESANRDFFSERIATHDIDRFHAQVEAAVRGQGPINLEYPVHRPDGTIGWAACLGVVAADEKGNPLFVHGLVTDITDRKEIELQVHESERQLRQQANSMPQMVWSAKPNGEVEYYNQQVSLYTGRSDEELARSGWMPLVHADERPLCHEGYARGIHTGRAFGFECRMRWAVDGSYRWHLVRWVPYRDEQGNLLRWFGTSTDIHEQKTAKERLEVEVEARTEELRHSLTEKETLLKEVHHRVKNNLQVISSLLRMQGDAVDDQVAAAALKESHQRVLSMALIHERLYGSEQMNEVNFGEYTKTLVNELFYSYAGQSRNVVSRVQTDSILLTVDRAIPCGLILNELVTNALKYAYPNGGGDIAIELKETAAGQIRLTVSDQGVGLPDGLEVHNLKSLGLPIVDILARQVGGTLTVHTKPGSTFVVEFPKEEARKPRAASAA